MPPSLRTRQKWTAIRMPATQRDADAVQDVEAQQRALADEASAEQREPRVGPGVDHLHVPQGQQLRTWPFMPESGVARAMLEPTVMAQMASWSQGSR